MPTPIQLSKFGSRIAALVIDILVLALIGIILGFTLQDFFIGLGAYGIFVGVIISVLYFTLQNSRFFNGQTIGKRTFDIQVTDKEGQLLSLQRSFARAVILCVPYFLVNAEFPGLHAGSVIYLLKSIVCIALVFGLILFFLVNKGTRQSIHDLLVGSYVVSTERLAEPVTLPAVTKASYYVFGIAAMFLQFLRLSAYPRSNQTLQMSWPFRNGSQTLTVW
ncbi:MAG: RDD family protein [Bacteroidales bacterium]|nr:RDD family protein [Bacteroidales bacterium]